MTDQRDPAAFVRDTYDRLVKSRPPDHGDKIMIGVDTLDQLLDESDRGKVWRSLALGLACRGLRGWTARARRFSGANEDMVEGTIERPHVDPRKMTITVSDAKWTDLMVAFLDAGGTLENL